MKFASLRDSKWYPIFLWTAFVVSLISIWLLSNRIFTTPKTVSSEDHWRYWSAWHLTIHGQNPYIAENLNDLRHQIPGLERQPEFLPIILTPPWTIALITPVAPFPYYTSRLLWLLVSIVILLICANFLWRIYNGSAKIRWVALLVTFTFFPTILMLKQGQINPWVLLGLVGFLYWTTQRRNDWLAGISVALMTIKPQVLLLFWIVLLFWIIKNQRWKIFLACCLTLTFASLLVMVRNPLIFHQFFNTYLGDTPVEWKTPTIGFYLRLWMGVDKFWLQFIAPIIGIIWSIIYWFRNGKDWRWSRDIIPLLWVSLLASPYSWTYDQIILLVPILSVTSSLLVEGWSKNSAQWLGLFWIINLLTLVLHRYYTDEYFIWFAPVLLIWYWLVKRSISGSTEARIQGAR